MTPTQIAILERHRAFRRKIAEMAKPDPGISCPSASGRVPAQEPPPPVESFERWAERQKAKHLVPREPWFSIIAEMGPPPPITISQIIRAVAIESELTREDIISARRSARVAMARQVAMYLAKEMTTFSLPALGRQFGRRDHTTVMHGVRKIENLWRTDSELRTLIERLKNQIRDEHNARYCRDGGGDKRGCTAALDD